ncbi:hypothetical protein SAMD00024442_82_3 [Candidatus Symbiothrix dinenymphae]|nr:hypothetical protein SAMD00024442_82_3 [Candidatus Symbiothrix dinenymphae]
MKIRKYFIGLFAVMCMTSCDYLDVVPDNTATVDHIFADQTAALRYLNSCYWSMPKSSHWDYNPAIMGAMEMVWNVTAAQNSAAMNFAQGKITPTNPPFNYWGAAPTGDGGEVRSLYAGIRDCNLFLENIETVADLEPDDKKRWAAEVKLIKAWEHFYLISFYGPICPLRTNMEVNASLATVRAEREKIDDCFAYVLELIQEVIDSDALPATISARASELGRFTKSVAYALKAKVLVYWASPLFNGNTDYNNFTNRSGEPFFNQTPDPTRWEKAATACKEAVTVCGQSGIRLYQKSDYRKEKAMSDTTWLVQTLRSAVSERYNPELIWGNSASDNTALQNVCWARLTTTASGAPVPSNRMSVPLSTVELFYSNKGIPIDLDPGFDYDNRFSPRTGDADHKFYIHNGQQTAGMNFDREPRFYSTLGFDRGKWYGNYTNNDPVDDSSCGYPQNRYGETGSASAFELNSNYNATGYFPKKLINLTSMILAVDLMTQAYPYPEFRFADLLLLTAEAVNEAEGPANAHQYIDLVRERAGLQGVVASYNQAVPAAQNYPADKDRMREIIQRERKIELACEGQYYWDSHRWKTALTEQNRPIQGWNIRQSNIDDYYTPATLYIQKFTQRDYFAPIPDDDIINNPMLVQNWGW